MRKQNVRKKTSNWSPRTLIFWWTDTHLKKKEWFALDRKRDRQTDALPENLVIFSLPHAVVRQNLSESGVLLSFLSDLSSDLQD